MNQQWTNNASSVIANAGGITLGALSLTVTTGHGDRFPAVTSPTFFIATLVDTSGNREIIKVTERTAGTNVFTIVRAQEGTSARAFAAGSLVELRITKGFLDDLPTKTDDNTFLGDQTISSANLTVAVGHVDTARATVASHATTADIWAAAGNQINWTGTATTTAFPAAPQAGAERVLICAGACSFTAGANMLIDGVTSGDTIACVTNDIVIVRAISTTQFHLSRVRYDGLAPVAADESVRLVSTGTIIASALAVHIDLPSAYNDVEIDINTHGANAATATVSDLFIRCNNSTAAEYDTVGVAGTVQVVSGVLVVNDPAKWGALTQSGLEVGSVIGCDASHPTVINLTLNNINSTARKIGDIAVDAAYYLTGAGNSGNMVRHVNALFHWMNTAAVTAVDLVNMTFGGGKYKVTGKRG